MQSETRLTTDATRGLGERIVMAMDRLLLCLEGLTWNEITWCPQREGARSLQGISMHVLGAINESVAILKQQRNRWSEHVAPLPKSLQETLALWSEERAILN